MGVIYGLYIRLYGWQYDCIYIDDHREQVGRGFFVGGAGQNNRGERVGV